MNFKTVPFLLGLGTLSFLNLCFGLDLGLDKHNELRANHHSKKMEASKELIDLAKSCAQDYAERNEIDHKCAEEHNLGENLYWSNGMSSKPEDAVQRAIKDWYDEKKNYNYNDPGHSKRGATGHFTQLVWNSSTHLGCGVSTVDGNTVVSCLYDPAGNVRGGKGGYQYYKENVKKPTK